MGLHELEERLRKSRQLEQKARESARKKFEAAVASLKKSGAEEITRTIAKLIPGLDLKTLYDFDEAGRQGSSPSIELKTPDKTGKPGELWQRREYVSSVSHRTLSVSSLVHVQGLVSVDLRESEILTDKYDKGTPAGHLLWNTNRRDYQDPKMLAEAIFHGLHGLLPAEDKRLATVREALELPEIHIPPALLPPARR